MDEQLNPWFITGFTDGEGCFSLYVRKDKQKRKNSVAVYYRWIADFAITLRGDDHNMIEKIAEYFGCGNVSRTNPKDYQKSHEYGQSHYSVRNVQDLVTKIILHFEKFPLQSKKLADFLLWKEAVVILNVARIRLGKQQFTKVVYTQQEQERLNQIFTELKVRLTGGHFKRESANILLDGTKTVLPPEAIDKINKEIKGKVS